MNWIEEFYEKNRLALWTLEIADLQSLEDFLFQEDYKIDPKKNEKIEKLIVENWSWGFQYFVTKTRKSVSG